MRCPIICLISLQLTLPGFILSSLSKPKEYLGAVPAFLILQKGFLQCCQTHAQGMGT